MIRLNELRGKRTQAQMAQLLGLPRETYRNYEVGSREPTIETLLKMADFFGVSVDYLLGLDGGTESASVAPMGETLTASERELLRAFRRITPAAQDLLIKTALTLAGEENTSTASRKKA